MKKLAIIPARSGSKGLKDKNIKLINGQRLIAYTIRAALSSEIFDEVMVSTDSNEYAEISISLGAKVPFLRSMENSSDRSTSWEVVDEVLRKYTEIGLIFDVVFILQPTSPLRDSSDIRNAYELYKNLNAKCIVSVCETEHSPLWSNTLGENLSMEGFIPKDIQNLPRQNLPKHYRLNGAIYIVDINYFYSNFELYGNKSYAFIMSKEHSIDIDSEIDFSIAEILLSKTQRLSEKMDSKL